MSDFGIVLIVSTLLALAAVSWFEFIEWLAIIIS